MRVLLTGDLSHAPTLRSILDTAHAKRRIAIVLHVSSMLASSMIAEQWANDHSVLCADIHSDGGTVGIFAVADSIIALPGTSDALLSMARDRGLKVWEPIKPS